MTPGFTRPVAATRYRVLRALYVIRRALGGPDFVDELDYWEGFLSQRPASLFDRAIRASAFPPELRSAITAVRPGGSRPRLLEVGSGPVSVLAAGVDDGLLDVVAVDPLARAYRELLRLCGVSYPIQPVPGRGERVATQFGPRSFDLLYSSNALDHTRWPRRCVEQMCAVLRPGGRLLLEGFVREGSQGNWVGLHQHDLFPEGGSLVHVDRAGRRTNLTADLPLTCLSERVCPFTDRGIVAFGYETPPDMPLGAPGDWRLREWYTLHFRRNDVAGAGGRVARARSAPGQ